MSKTEKPPAEPTAYVVLRRQGELVDEGPSWLVVDSKVSARSANEAIRKTASEGTYVAVPARSFRAVTVTAEVQTRLKLESA